jgi:hypothetical protein
MVAELQPLVFGAADPLQQDMTLLALLEKLPPDKARMVARVIAELVHGVVQL